MSKTSSSSSLADAISHSCTDRKCSGQKFDGLHIKCSRCGQKIFMECIHNRPGSIEILQLLDVITSNNEIQNTYFAQTKFNAIFHFNSPFALLCDFCRLPSNNVEITRLNKELNEMQSKCAQLEDELASNKLSDNQQTKNIELLGAKIVASVQNTIKAELELMPSTSTHATSSNPSTNKSTKQKSVSVESANPKPDVNGLYSIFVSNSDKTTTADKVTAQIVDKTELDTNVFSVELLSNMNRKRKHNSFKVTMFTLDVYKKIISDENWSPDYKAKPFKQRSETNKQQKSITSNERETRDNNNYKNNNKNTNTHQFNRNERRTGTYKPSTINAIKQSQPKRSRQQQTQEQQWQRQQRHNMSGNGSLGYQLQQSPPGFSPLKVFEQSQQPYWHQYNQNQATNHPFWYPPSNHYPPVQPFIQYRHFQHPQFFQYPPQMQPNNHHQI